MCGIIHVKAGAPAVCGKYAPAYAAGISRISGDEDTFTLTLTALGGKPVPGYPARHNFSFPYCIVPPFDL